MPSIWTGFSTMIVASQALFLVQTCRRVRRLSTTTVIYNGRNIVTPPPAEAVERRGMSAMSLLDLKIDRRTLPDMDKLSELSTSLEHHDLLVDVLREEFEESVRKLRALTAEPNPESW